MLIISLRKLSSSQKNNLKQFYKVLIYDQRLHVRKTISQLVKVADIILVELDLSRVFSISRNIVYKWLKQQDIVDIATTFVYESSKYKSLFKDNINFFIRKLPLLFDRELERVIDDQNYLDQETKSVYHPETEPEEDTTVSTETTPILASEEAESLVKRIDDIEKQINSVIERLKRLEGEPVTKTTIDQKTAPVERTGPFKPQGRRDESLQVRQTREWKVKQGSKKFIVIESVDGKGDKIINEFPYCNGIEKRKAKKQAGRTLLTLQKG